jgi:hypothetical protein
LSRSVNPKPIPLIATSAHILWKSVIPRFLNFGYNFSIAVLLDLAVWSFTLASSVTFPTVVFKSLLWLFELAQDKRAAWWKRRVLGQALDQIHGLLKGRASGGKERCVTLQLHCAGRHLLAPDRVHRRVCRQGFIASGFDLLAPAAVPAAPLDSTGEAIGGGGFVQPCPGLGLGAAASSRWRSRCFLDDVWQPASLPPPRRRPRRASQTVVQKLCGKKVAAPRNTDLLGAAADS